MRSITSTGTQLAIGLALCGAVLVGTLLSDDSEQTTPSTHALPVVSPSVSFNTSPTRVSSPVVVMPSSPLASSGRSTGDVAVSSYASARRSTNILVSTPSRHTSSPMGGGGGGGAMGASSSSSVASSPSSSSSGGYAGGGYTSSVPMVLFAPGAKTVVVAPPTTIPSGFMGTGGSTTLPLYEGDEPGIIPGATNGETENPIVTSYGLPIGDTLWPLLLLALVYVGIKLLFNKRKMNKQTLHSMLSTLSHILFRRQRSTAEVSSCSSVSSRSRSLASWRSRTFASCSRTLACALALCALCTLFSTRAWAVTETRNDKQYNVVYLSRTGTGTGDSKDSPVNTWTKAYNKLTNTGNRDYDWEHNIIVIVGDMQINYKEGDTKDKSNKQGTAATITGVWPWDANDKATTTQIKSGGQAKIAGITNNIGAEVRFRNLRIQGDGGAQDRLCLRLHSTLFDEGLVMMGFTALGEGFGMIVGRNAPAFHIQFSFDHDGSARASDVKYEMPGDTAMTVTFKSGRYGRVAVSRSQGTSESVVKANYIQGTPEKPVMAHIVVDIQDGNDNTGNTSGTYADDIGILLGGSSQGIVCADLQFDIKRGTIGTLVAGAQGNNIGEGNKENLKIEEWKIPQGTFAGRTIINLESNDVTVQNLYVGTQGRTQAYGLNGTAYFYGQATLNMRGGTVEKGVFASAAAFSGLGNDTYHTPDYAIPYVDNNNVLTFGSYDNTKTMATIKSTYHGDVDLSETVVTMNIYGGTIKGGLCGGSRGFDSYVKVKYAPAGAGSLYGNTNVNVYGGTISGGVYGGGLGDSSYYEDTSTDGGKPGFLTVAQVFGNTNVNIYGGTITGGIYGGGKGVSATTKNEYIDISRVYGTTNVTINPQTLKSRAEWADPEVPEFTGPNNDWTYTGNIYGGGAMGAVTGSTNVQVLGGIINGKVFAAGQGEEGHDEKAKIVGNPAVTVEGGAISQNLYGGGEMAKVEGNTGVTVNGGSFGADIFGGGEGKLYTVAGGGHAVGDVSMSADVSGETHVTINGGEFAVAYDDSKPQPYPFKEHYNIYGGGNIASQVGESHVYVTKGMVSNSSDGSGSFLDNDRFVSHEAGMAQAYYREGQMYFCVFGGGYGKNTSVTGNTWVDFHIGDGDGILDITETDIEDDLLEYQSYLDVIGGGFNGAVAGNTNVHVGGNAMCRNVYGGGLYATIGNKGRGETGETHVHITGGNIDNVYGGGVMGDIMTSTNVNIGLKASLSFDGRTHAQDNNKVTVLMSVYGGNDVSGHVPTANITHNGGKVEQNIYGAGNGDYRGYYTPNHCAYADGDNDNYFMVKHASDDANSGPTYKGRPQTDNVNITLGGNSTTDKAVVLGQVFGGGNSCTIGTWKTIAKGDKHDGDPHAWRNDPEFFEGGGQLQITLGSHVKIGYDNTTLAAASDDIKAMYVRDEENVSGLFMGASGNVLATQSDADNYHHYYDATAHQYKPGFASTDGADAFKAYLNNILVWTDNVQLTIANDAEDIWIANFVGGGFRGSMKRKTDSHYAWTLPAGVTVGNCVLGGAYNADVKYKDSNLDLRYAGGLLASDGTNHADVVLTLNNQMDGGVNARVFGGCFSSGSVRNTQIDYRATGAHDVYGGGALANLTGNSVVNLLGGSLTNAYGGGLGSNEVAALVNGNATTTLDGSVVEGAIFGANNVNGTPEGHVKVHVLATSPRDGQTEGQFDVAAVYGGGNQAAYVPSQATFDANKGYAEVLIENCDNSIDYVYGGGNAAPVPATSVTIYGADTINNAFAGGNGAGIGNPGADVGYNGYYSLTAGLTPTYGSGESHISVYGGTVHNVFGGSNTLGYVRTHAYVNIKETPQDYEGAECDLHVGNTYAGGNEAEMFCGGSVTLECAEGTNVVYAGANSADIHGDIDLVINSGTYGKVFGGNNESGNVYGHIKIDIDETGCYPIMIGELYGGGNKAAYSVYGYNDDGSVKTSGEKLYTDPTINIISFTGIGRIFGGGKGETAVVYGNPTININPIKGEFAGQNPRPLYILDGSYNRLPNKRNLDIPDEVGKIAAVYGGGNEAAVFGNTTVNIGNLAQNNHLNAEPGDEPEDVDAIIAGNIYGGGSQADINGNTHVNIQVGTVLGNVYGGGEGVADDATKAKVTGTTKVTIGE